MTEEQTVNAQQEVQEETHAPEQQQEKKTSTEETPSTHVPLSALQKERQKRKEYEERLRYYEELERQKQAQQQQEEEDPYEPLTKAEFGQSKSEITRNVLETLWVKDNPDKAAEVNEKLDEFLKQRPHLRYALNAVPNRYEEAWNLMEALTPREKKALMTNNEQPKKEAPASPSSVPKAAGMNQAVDVMSMTDQEFNAWRKSKKQRR